MKRMELDFSKMMTGDEWHFLHTPEMYYAVYAENADPERAALAAYRKARREMERAYISEMARL